jgi:hypothetical protein
MSIACLYSSSAMEPGTLITPWLPLQIDRAQGVSPPFLLINAAFMHLDYLE